MKTIKIKLEGAEVEQKFVNYSEVLDILKKEDEYYMNLYEEYKEHNAKTADACLERAIQADVTVKKLHRVFGGEFD